MDLVILKNKTKIVVIGGNAAGPAAAAKAKRVNSDAEVILFEKSPFISTGTCELPYLFDNTIDDYKKTIFFDADSFLRDKGVKVYVNSPVININRKNKQLTANFNNNEQKVLNYDKLILATGSAVEPIANFNFQQLNYSTIKSIRDYIKISDYLKINKVKNISIIGAGYTGLEIAETLNNAGYNINLFDKLGEPLSYYGTEISNYIKDKLSELNIQFWGNAENLSCVCSDNRIKFIKIKGRSVETDYVIQTTGVKPNNTLAVGAGITTGKFGGIKVDSKLKTNDYDIYAVGDNIELQNFITKQYDYFPLATIARQTGYVAGANAAGGNDYFPQVIKNISFKFFDSTISSVGLHEHECSSNKMQYSIVDGVADSLVKIYPGSRKVFGKIIYNKNTNMIYGAQFLGGLEVTGYADKISLMIQNNIKADKLSESFFNYSPPVSPFVNLLNLLGQKIKIGK